MKTISSQEAAEQFEKYSNLAHNGERILVTLEGKPWILLTPPADATAPARQKPEWPDFVGRLAEYYPETVNGPTATELLAEDKEDRF